MEISIEKLSELTGLSIEHIRTATELLIKKGLITKTETIVEEITLSKTGETIAKIGLPEVDILQALLPTIDIRKLISKV